jgi:hypothetical protein
LYAIAPLAGPARRMTGPPEASLAATSIEIRAGDVSHGR